jgi:hypothetical protein
LLGAVLAAAVLPTAAAMAAVVDGQGCVDSWRSANQCAQPFHEGLAAVQFGKISHRRLPWGYIDTNGNVAIAPRFDDATPFSHGLAAVRDGDLWGYIDTRGRWVIPARYDDARAFGKQGTALVEQHGGVTLIDRSGKTLKTFAKGARLGYRGFDPKVGLAVLEVPVSPVVWRGSDGKSYRLPKNVEQVGEPQAGWIPAAVRATPTRLSWGYLDSSMQWAVKPSAIDSDNMPLTDGHLVLVWRHGKKALITPDGKVIKDGLFRARLIAPGLWLLIQSKKTAAGATFTAWLYDGQGRMVRNLGNRGRVRVDTDLDGTALAALVETPESVFLVGRNARIKAKVDGADIDKWGHYLFAFKNSSSGGDHELLQVFDAQGAPVLEPATVKRLGAYYVYALMGGDPAPADRTVFVAVLLPRKSGAVPFALLTSDGRIVDGSGELLDADTKRSMRPYVAAKGSEGKYGVIGVDGTWRIPPDYDAISAFSQGYALARRFRNGETQYLLLDTKGREYPIPRRIQGNVARRMGTVIVFRQRHRGTRPTFGLWSVTENALIRKADIDRVERFHNGRALARVGEQWGLLDLKGRWRALPGVKSDIDVEPLGDAYVIKTVPKKHYAGVYSIYSLLSVPDDRIIASGLKKKPVMLADGRYLVRPLSGGVALIDIHGKALARAAHAVDDVVVKHGWVILKSDHRYGAIDAGGQWRVPPVYASRFSFVPPSNLARVGAGGRQTLIDTHGEQVPGPYPGAVPVPGMRRLVFNDTSENQTLMTDLAGKVVARLPGPYALETDDAADGLVPFEDKDTGHYGLMDADGRKLIGAYFDKLGAMRDDRAAAMMKNRYGKFYGFIDRAGRFAIMPRFAWVSGFHENRALVSLGAACRYIDQNGNVVVSSDRRDGMVALVDAAGKTVWPVGR